MEIDSTSFIKYFRSSSYTSNLRHQILACLVMLCIAGLLYAFYSQAKGLSWGFDDWINLKNLSQATNREGLINFIFGGTAGPTGRPVSLLAFVPNYVDWPNNPYGFVKGTLIWHFLNTLLVFLLVCQILRVVKATSSSCYWLAALGALYWALLPIHASGILMPVQRMTHISAFFTLVAMNVFLYWRIHYAGTSKLAPAFFALFVTSVVIILSVYAKENGVVVVTYLAVIEILLFDKLLPPINRKFWKLGTWVAISSIPVLMLSYLVIKWEVVNNSYDITRDFNLVERLATQAVILWEYIKALMLPRAAVMGPFHDGHAIFSWRDIWPGAAVVGWISIIGGAAFWCKTKHVLGRFSLFAIIFFVAGQSIESSFIPLELYFEHRNYLPVLGWVIFALVLLNQLLRKFNRKILIWSIVVGLLSYNAFSLQQVTSLWGKPLLAAEMWYRMHPNSTRAVQTLATNYSWAGMESEALRVLDDFSSDTTLGRFDVKIQAFSLACYQEDDVSMRLSSLQEAVDYIKRPNGIVTGLPEMGKAIRNGECGGVFNHDYRFFLKNILQHPKVSRAKKVRHYLYHELSLLAESDGRLMAAIDFEKSAFHDFPALRMAQKIGLDLFRMQREEEALDWIKEALKEAPNRPSKFAWEKSLESLRLSILEIQRLRAEAEESIEFTAD